MPAPTARLAPPPAPESVPLPAAAPDSPEELECAALAETKDDEGDPSLCGATVDIDMSNAATAPGRGEDVLEGRPSFPAISHQQTHRTDKRKVPIPPHRMSPLKRQWSQIYPPLVENLKLQIRMNPSRKIVELRSSKKTPEGVNALQRGEDFVKAFAMGFEVADAIAFLRVDELYIETFEIKDVKTLQGDHLSRAIGRIAGKDGKTKYAIENASRTRIVLADSKIHILGSFQNIHMARESIVDLIRGKQPGKVYGNLQRISKRMKERF